jgi:transposase
MDEISDDAKGGFRRVELLTGPGRRRRWSAEDKARVIAETLAPGVRVSDVARRWQLHPQQVFGWRHEARKDTAAQRRAISGGTGPSFVPIVTESEAGIATTEVATRRSSIEIDLAGAVIRVMSNVDGEVLTTVLRAVRSSVTAA